MRRGGLEENQTFHIATVNKLPVLLVAGESGEGIHAGFMAVTIKNKR
jgi:hypothetical protein